MDAMTEERAKAVVGAGGGEPREAVHGGARAGPVVVACAGRCDIFSGKRRVRHDR